MTARDLPNLARTTIGAAAQCDLPKLLRVIHPKAFPQQPGVGMDQASFATCAAPERIARGKARKPPNFVPISREMIRPNNSEVSEILTPDRMIVHLQKSCLLGGSLSVNDSGRKWENFHAFDNIQLSLLIT